MKNILAILITVLIAGCSYLEKDNAIASLNGRDITQQEFDAYLKFKRIQIRDDKHRAKVLDQYLEREALSQVIQDNFDEKLNSATQAELDAFRRQMNISRYFENYLRQSVTEQKIENYYAANIEQFSDTKVKVAHILFRLNNKMSENERKVKLTTAMDALSRIKAGEDFAGVARDFSEDRISAKKAGELGWLKKGSISPKFSQKIFNMKSDELSGPFETSFGYHIIKVLEEPKTVKKPFEAVKGDIRYQLRQQTRQLELARLKSQVKIKLNQ